MCFYDFNLKSVLFDWKMGSENYKFIVKISYHDAIRNAESVGVVFFLSPFSRQLVKIGISDIDRDYPLLVI